MNIKEKIVLTVIGLIVLLVIAFNVSKELLCSPDTSVRKVAFPLAKVIFEHIKNNDVPENLSDIKEIPYELIDCDKMVYQGDMRDYIHIEKNEECNFENKKKTYILKVENHFNNLHTYHNIYIDVTQNKTKYTYSMRYNMKKKQWDYEYFPNANVYYDWDCWICNPKLFRITD